MSEVPKIRNLLTVLQYTEKKSIVTAFMAYCDRKHSDILQGSSHFRCYLFLDGCVQKRAQPFKLWKYKTCCIYSILKVLKVTSLQYLYNNIKKG